MALADLKIQNLENGVKIESNTWNKSPHKLTRGIAYPY